MVTSAPRRPITSARFNPKLMIRLLSFLVDDDGWMNGEETFSIPTPFTPSKLPTNS